MLKLLTIPDLEVVANSIRMLELVARLLPDGTAVIVQHEGVGYLEAVQLNCPEPVRICRMPEEGTRV